MFISSIRLIGSNIVGRQDKFLASQSVKKP